MATGQIREMDETIRWMIGLLLLGVTTLVVGEPRGGELYAAHCAGCHGDTGQGGVGVPLSLPSFLESVDDNFLYTTIRMGRPGRVMPAFRVLSDAQVEAIVLHIRSWSGKPEPVFSNKPLHGDAQHGQQLYASYCAACHGANGEGGRGTGVTFSRKRDLPIIAPALNNAGFLAAASDEMIRHTLQFGREGTPMRSFLVQGLSEQDIEDLVSFVRTFEKQALVSDEPGATVAETTLWAESAYTLEETIENLKDAIVSQNFILIRQDTLEHGLVNEGEEDPSQVILHFCNFKFLFEALAVDPRVGMFLPCRITVTEKDGKVLASAINPLYLSRLFNNNELNEYCKQMHAVYSAILEDATL
jgi:cytochrome c oxidase cbb3-type subunit 3